MPAGDTPHGRRDNGLVAADYAMIGPVDPGTGERLLATLAARGIAAYLQPPDDQPSVVNITSRAGLSPDQLYADREHLAAARIIAAIVAGTPPPAEPEGGVDIDSAFAGIVASLHRSDNPDIPSWPHIEPWPRVEDSPTNGHTLRRRRTDRTDRTDTGQNKADSGADSGDNAGEPEGLRAGEPDERSLLDALDTFGVGLPDDEADDEHFVPPPPPPLPRPSPGAVGAVLAVVVGLVLLIRPTLLPISANAALMLGFSGILSGFLFLIWRLRPGPDDNDPDNGA
ncbi:MAG: DUF308 domain-containing protein, partial [Micromonosporaceae bacterium]|nr:DUF308 domain-containing protein [Micromonosporaceae bacterium]